MSPARSTTAVVTGASRGIGLALAVALAESGRSVGLIGRDHGALDDALCECQAYGVRAQAVVCDLTDPASHQTVLARLQQDLGPIDLLINNAGKADATPGPLWQADPVDWWATVKTNLLAPFLACRTLIPDMIARGHGRVVNIGTLMGMTRHSQYAAYSISKAALTRLTDCLAQPLESQGVSVFEISPGPVKTTMSLSMPMMRRAPDEAWSTTESIERFVLAIADGRLDALVGRFIDASLDDLDDLLAHADTIRALDARTLRLRAYRDGDPVTRASERLGMG